MILFPGNDEHERVEHVIYISPEELCPLIRYGSKAFSGVTNSLTLVAAQNFSRIPGK